MPYIHTFRRKDIEPVCSDDANDTGELNFQITCLLQEYLSAHGTSYATINDIMGALEAAKLEFYRRIAAPHEDRKIGENGDVYGD